MKLIMLAWIFEFDCAGLIVACVCLWQSKKQKEPKIYSLLRIKVLKMWFLSLFLKTDV